MGKLNGTQTLQNLMQSFVGESQARMRYTFFASVAKKEGYVQISNIFTETAGNEKEHGELFYKYIVSNEYVTGEAVNVNVNADFPVALSDTKNNLLHAASGENEEWKELYPKFAEIAKKEGFPEIAETWLEVVVAEKAHETRYLKLAANIELGRTFKRFSDVKWKCSNCGYIYEGAEVPDTCPACKHAKDYFELFEETY
ncbi:rubrerythrin family protein [Acetobacterium paludosum]|uniref:Rubrerythrin family protein n=2 Tax=Acetobacterium TaxID=33951 RepID=A0A923I1W3_9FIRM|nr:MULTISPECIES: rubrerythrin family protein [Acetobacterium]MBC3796133.1 rubrerythrin family protein [Acetobacterium tundrae]MBC3887565.1 rubrerythrin family protein [Acetobacterium paludosum]